MVSTCTSDSKVCFTLSPTATAISYDRRGRYLSTSLGSTSIHLLLTSKVLNILRTWSSEDVGWERIFSLSVLKRGFHIIAIRNSHSIAKVHLSCMLLLIATAIICLHDIFIALQDYSNNHQGLGLIGPYLLQHCFNSLPARQSMHSWLRSRVMVLI